MGPAPSQHRCLTSLLASAVDSCIPLTSSLVSRSRFGSQNNRSWTFRDLREQRAIACAGAQLVGRLSLHRLRCSKDLYVRWHPYKTHVLRHTGLLNPEEQAGPQEEMLFSLQFLSPGVFLRERLVFIHCLCRCACLHFHF